ncbi:hypothetical protein Leryth_003861 [Lithospermum erythrorhizon]|nr:hypothetical protein Leryth_003861 [Lithospermum erythrorhizon]
MAAALNFIPPPSRSNPHCRLPPSTTNLRRPALVQPPLPLSVNLSATTPPKNILLNKRTLPFLPLFSNNNNNNNNNSGGGGGGGGGGDDDDDNNRKNRKEAMMILENSGRVLDRLPDDLKAAVLDGRIPGSILLKYFDLEKSALLAWLLKFGGFRERLLADDLFLAKLAMECGVGMFTKTLAEYERRRENFFNELEVVFADVVMAVIADFMLVYLPAPTVSLRAPLALNAGGIAKFFHHCPDNAFQVSLPGTSYSFLQRLGAILRNGTKLFAVGTASSLVGTSVTNAVINARKVVDKAAGEEVENVPILATSAAYGVYMGISSNLRYQILAGVIEQRILEPVLHQHKLILSALCFAVRTGNTFLGSLLWVDYARWVGIQKVHEIESSENVSSPN